MQKAYHEEWSEYFEGGKKKTLQARFKVYLCKGARFWDADATHDISRGCNIFGTVIVMNKTSLIGYPYLLTIVLI
jgi:hypothetical protein